MTVPAIQPAARLGAAPDKSVGETSSARASAARLLIVIVNYRTPKLTIDCLESLQDDLRRLPNGRVAVVDNHSQDGSFEQIESAVTLNGWSPRVVVLRAERNGGFAFGNNAAIRSALASSNPPDFVMLLNPAAVARPGAVIDLLRFAESNPRVGIMGSRLEEPDGTPQTSAFRFVGVIGEFEAALAVGVVRRLLRPWVIAPEPRDVSHETDWVAGASMLVRRDVFDSVGELDEGYFLYFDEVDFCLRARRAGWPCWYVVESRVVHLAGQATGVSSADQRPKRRPSYWFEARRRYHLKNFGPVRATLADAATIIGHCLRRARCFVQRRPSFLPPRFVRDLIHHSVFGRGYRL